METHSRVYDRYAPALILLMTTTTADGVGAIVVGYARSTSDPSGRCPPPFECI
jgi:hypothetical protein